MAGAGSGWWGRVSLPGGSVSAAVAPPDGRAEAGGTVLVLLASEPNIWQELLLLREVRPGRWSTFDPDLSPLSLDLKSHEVLNIRVMPTDRSLPLGVGAGSSPVQVFRFEDGTLGRLPSDAEVRSLTEEYASLEGMLVTNNDAQANGPEWGEGEGGRLRGGARRVQGKTVDPDAAWVVAEPHPDMELGTEVNLGSELSGGDRALFQGGLNQFVLVMWVKRKQIENFKEVRKMELAGLLHAGASGADQVARSAANRTPRGEEAPALTAAAAGPAADEEDARTLPVLFDEHGERWRDWKQVTAGSSENFYEDWPVDGPRTALWTMKNMQKTSGTPMGWLNKLIADKKIGSSDRMAYELQAWVRLVETAGSYDQLNLPTLASFEIAMRQIAILFDAFNRDPINPKFEDEEVWSGQQQKAEGIAPVLTAHVASRLKDKAEIEKQRQKAAEVRGLVKNPPGGNSAATKKYVGARHGAQHAASRPPSRLTASVIFAWGFEPTHSELFGSAPSRLPDVYMAGSRELFPLPFLPVEPTAGFVSRGVRQRIGRRRHETRRVNDVVQTLNWMSGGSSASPPAESSAAQRQCLDRIQDAVRRTACVETPMQPHEAARALLRSKAGYAAGEEDTTVHGMPLPGGARVSP